MAYGPRGMLAFEVKRKGRVSRTDASSLCALRTDYPEAHCCLLYGGDRREYWEGIEVLPASEAILSLLRILAAGSAPLDR